MPKTLAAEARSQYATDFLDTSGQDEALLDECWPVFAFAPMF
jgi:hypothetical protein